jgi:tetratricopeptide (TPR) repeat protein
MNRFLIFLLLFISLSCTNKSEDDPYSDILSNPPFAGLTDSIKRSPGNDDLYFRRAVLLNTNNYPEPALADFRKAWELKKLEPYALGIGTLLQDRKPDSAVVFLRDAIRQIPNSLMLRLSLARAYDLAANLDEAIRVCNEILQIEPLQVDVLKFKADLLLRKNQSAAAIQTLEKAYSIAPFDVELNYELASQYAETKNAKVLSLCDSLIRQDTDSMNLHAEPYYFKGVYYANLKQPEKAIELFDAAILRNYYYLNAYIEKGKVLLEQKKIDEALKTFNLALTLSPKFPDAYYWIGKCQETLGQKEEAKLNYLRAYSLDKEFIEAKEAADKL